MPGFSGRSEAGYHAALEPSPWAVEKVVNPASPAGESRSKSALDLRLAKDDHVDTRTRDATRLTLNQTVNGKIDSRNDQDWFKITVTAKGNYTFRSSGNGDFHGELFGAKGMTAVTQDDNGAGDNRNFSMTAELNPGTYYVRVMGRKSPGADYGLTVTGGNNPAPPPPPPTPPPSGDHKFKIVLNFDFDKSGYFSRNPEMRKVMQEAADAWAAFIKDDFKSVKAGTTVHAGAPGGIGNDRFTLKEDLDDMMIFVRSEGGGMGGGASGQASPLTFSGKNGDFEPNFGAVNISIGRGCSKHIAKIVMMHEIGHVLGIGCCDVFNKHLRGNTYSGPNAKAANNGQDVQMANGGHVAFKYRNDLMTPVVSESSRISAIDKGMLKDMGYKIS